MATRRESKTSSIIIVKEVGTSGSGNMEKKTKTFNNVNDALSDDDFLAVAKSIDGLIQYTTNSYRRRDTCIIVEDE